MSNVIIYFDGSYKSRRGHCSCGGWVARNSKEIGRVRASDVLCESPIEAEYRALIMSLSLACDLNLQEELQIEVRGDNQVCIMQMTNQVKCHDKKIKKLKGRAKLLASRFKSVTYRWVPRSQNKIADQIARG